MGAPEDPGGGTYTPPVAPVDAAGTSSASSCPTSRTSWPCFLATSRPTRTSCLLAVRLAFLNTQVTADIDDLDAAIDVLRARAAGTAAADPFRAPMRASSTRDWQTPGTGPPRPGDSTSRPSSRCSACGVRRRETGPAADPVPRAERRDPSGDLGVRHSGDPATGSRSRGLRRARPVARRRRPRCRRWRSSRAPGPPNASCWPATPRRAGRRSTSSSVPSRLKAGAWLSCDDLPCASVWSRMRAIDWLRSSPGPDADPTPEQPGIDEDDLETMARRIDQLLQRAGRGGERRRAPASAFPSP